MRVFTPQDATTILRHILVVTLINMFLILPVGLSETLVSFEGKVLDLVTRKPIANATITIPAASIETTTDKGGVFVITDISVGDYKLHVSHVGYKKVNQNLSLVTGDSKRLLIYLEPVTISIEGTTVTATRFSEDKFSMPVSVSVTSREKFHERDFSTTAEVLREEPGILVQKTTHGHGAPIIRGLIGKHVLLLYDGIRLNKPTFRFGANQYLNTIDLESLEKIEVVRGPSSVMYGSDAIGGAVNLIPTTWNNNNEQSRITTSFSGRYSSADDGKSIGLKVRGNHRRFLALISGTYKDIGDLRAGGDIGRQKPTGWNETNFNTQLTYRLRENSTCRFDYLAVRQNQVPRYDKYVSGDFTQYLYDPQDRDLLALTIDSKLLGSIVHSLKGNLSYQREVEGKILQKTNSGNVTESEDRISTWGSSFQLISLLNESHWLSFGGEYYYDKVRSKRFEISLDKTEQVRSTFPDNSEYHSTGLFLQDEYNIIEPLTFTLGCRYSFFKMVSPLEEPFGHFSETYNDLTGSFAASYLFIPEVNLVGRWSRGFRAPNLNDATVLKYSSSGVDAPSSGLNPEYSNNYELGFKVQSSKLVGSLFCFYNQLNDLIDRRHGIYDGKTYFDENDNGIKDSTEADIFQRYNVGRARVYGIEFSSELAINSNWEMRVNCSWTFGENQSEHEPLSRIPPLMGLAALRYKLSDHAWIEFFTRMATDQRRLSTRDKLDSRIDEEGTPGWVTFNIRSQISFNQFTLNIALQNLTDTTYKEHGSGVYSAGRNLLLSIVIL